MPYIVKVANKELPVLHVFGNDYDTPDGTGVKELYPCRRSGQRSCQCRTQAA